jgi:hypothetical protein
VALASTAAPIFARLGFVNIQSTPAYFLTVELLDSCSALFLARHFDKAEAA